MNQIINRLRKSKRKLKQVFKMIKSDVDFEGDFVDSKLLNELSIISKINEELTDIIYMILDKENEDKNNVPKHKNKKNGEEPVGDASIIPEKK